MLIVNARFLCQQITGVQRFAIELSKELKQKYKQDIKFVAPFNIIHHDIGNILNAEVIGVHIGHLWEQIDLPLYLKKNNQPLLICFSNTAPIFYSNKISTIHDITFIRYPKTYSNCFKLLYNILIPIVLKTSKHIFTVSKFSQNEICSYYKIKKSKISVIYNAVNQIFKPKHDETLFKSNYILAVSSIKENKNFPIILKSFEIVQKRIPSIKLYIIGEINTPSFKREETIVKQLENNVNIIMLGRVSDEKLIKYYSNAKAFIFPSLYEGFGIPALEAQACGCPVVSSNSSSLPEVLNDSALMCNPYMEKEFADAILSIITNDSLYFSLKDKGLKNVKRFSWSKSCFKIINSL